MRLWPRTLAAQLVALLLAALVLSLAASFALFFNDRADAVRQADRAGLLERVASVARILEATPKPQRPLIADIATSPRLRFWISPESAVADSGEGRVILRNMFERMFAMPLRAPPRLAFVPLDPPGDDDTTPGRPRFFDRFDVIASVPFSDGGWLNAQTRIRAEPVPFPWPSTIPLAIMAVAVLGIVIVVARRVTRPLTALAGRAEALGRGTAEEPLREEGPEEARRLIGAFNRMQERLRRFVGDRTRMLAAIGHDLRTPITSLKLRAELLDDEEARTRMLATLDEMQRMTEATLAFARDDAAAEPTRVVDLAALLDSIVDDLADMGKPVTFIESPRFPYSCRPTALKRAVGNLIDNAIQYGERARVSLEARQEGPVIVIDDDGPGIPEGRIEEVFKPFVRLEESRNRATGGAGLGLSIARSIVLSHGGELVLANRKGGGLRAEIRLPAAEKGSLAA
ncbi:MAG TPA: ATP-binding protein [Bauldia sp.]|nr:ATP-binding protein [Bauldia sp.]